VSVAEDGLSGASRHSNLSAFSRIGFVGNAQPPMTMLAFTNKARGRPPIALSSFVARRSPASATMARADGNGRGS
jgi:hypothetical protein